MVMNQDYISNQRRLKVNNVYDFEGKKNHEVAKMLGVNTVEFIRKLKEDGLVNIGSIGSYFPQEYTNRVLEMFVMQKDPRDLDQTVDDVKKVESKERVANFDSDVTLIGYRRDPETKEYILLSIKMSQLELLRKEVKYFKYKTKNIAHAQQYFFKFMAMLGFFKKHKGGLG